MLSTSPPAASGPPGVRLARNALAGLLRGLVTFPLGLVLTYLVYHRLGTRELGVWASLSLFTGVTIPFNFGINQSLIRQVAAHRHSRTDIAGVVTSAVLLYVLLGIGIVIFYAWGRPWFIPWLASHTRLPETVLGPSVNLALMGFLVLFSGLPLYGLLYGIEEVPAAQLGLMCNQLVVAVLLALFLDADRGLIFLYVAVLAGAVTQIMVHVTSSFRHLGYLPFCLGSVSGTWIRRLLIESSGLFVLEVYRVVFFYLDKWILMSAFGGAVVGLFELGARLGLAMRGVLNSLSATLLAAASRSVHSDSPRERIQRLSYYSMRYLGALAVPILVFTTIEASTILTVWIGEVPPGALATLRVLVPSYLVNGISWSVFFLIIGQGHIRQATWIGLLGIGSNILFDILALRLVGNPHALMVGSACASLITGLVLVSRLMSGGDLSGRRLGPSVARISLAAVVAGILISILGTHGTMAVSRAWGIVRLSVLGTVFGISYLVLLWKTGEIDVQDNVFIDQIRNSLPRMPWPKVGAS